MSSGAKVTSPRLERLAARRTGRRARAPRATVSGSPRKRACRRVQPVAHRVGAAVHRRQLDGVRPRPDRRACRTGRPPAPARTACRQTRCPARSARRSCATSGRGASACGWIRPDDLAHEPVVAVRVRASRRPRAPPPGRRPSCSDDGADLGLVEPQAQERVVELAERAQRPELVAGRQELVRRVVRLAARLGRADRQRRTARLARSIAPVTCR